jgi:SAM-dependent methyltransferase
MHLKFLPILQDPFTGEELIPRIDKQVGNVVIEGQLLSSSNSFPIIRRIPRFVGRESYAHTFGWQWNRWPRVQFESENIGKPMEGYTKNMWAKITGFSEAKIDGKVVLDIGCGPGRFIDIARSRNAIVVGVDYSMAVEAARQNFVDDEGVLIVQADALRLPFRRESFEFAFSIGVLHHTPSPYDGVREAFRVLKNDGQFALTVYGKGGYYDFPTVKFWRRLFKLLWPVFGHYPPLIYSYWTTFLLRPIARVSRPTGLAIRAFFPFVNLPDIRWSLLDTFDSVTPSYQSAHESHEVWRWLESAGFNNVQPTDWGFTSYRGSKITHC